MNATIIAFAVAAPALVALLVLRKVVLGVIAAAAGLAWIATGLLDAVVTRARRNPADRVHRDRIRFYRRNLPRVDRRT